MPAGSKTFCRMYSVYFAPEAPSHDATDQRVALGRIVKLLAGLREQWIIFEEVETSLDRIVEVFCVSDLGIVLRAGLVMPDAGEMSHH